MKKEIVAVGKTGRTIIIKTSLLNSSLIHTVVLYPNGNCESRFKRNINK